MLCIISGSGMCDASQLPSDRLVLSITCKSVDAVAIQSVAIQYGQLSPSVHFT